MAARVVEIACFAHCPESRFILSDVSTRMH
jgi:hypothetical protein